MPSYLSQLAESTPIIVAFVDPTRNCARKQQQQQT